MRPKPDQHSSLVFENVEAGYDVSSPVFDRFDLTLDGLGILHVAGANGAGKSTFIELMSGYLKPWKGSVSLNGTPAHAEVARPLRTVCRTNPALYSNMTTHDHLHLAARVAGVSPDNLLSRADTYGLSPWLHARAQSLSTGNMKKLWILMCTPTPRAFTALDEPFDALDQAGMDVLLEEIQCWARNGLVLIVAHQAPTAVSFDGVVTLPHPTTRTGLTEIQETSKGRGIR